MGCGVEWLARFSSQARTSSARNRFTLPPGLRAIGNPLDGSRRMSQSARLPSFRYAQTIAVVHHSSSKGLSLVTDRPASTTSRHRADPVDTCPQETRNRCICVGFDAPSSNAIANLIVGGDRFMLHALKRIDPSIRFPSQSDGHARASHPQSPKGPTAQAGGGVDARAWTAPTTPAGEVLIAPTQHVFRR